MACFVAAKAWSATLKFISWVNKHWVKKKMAVFATKIASWIVEAIHTVVYKIANTVPDKVLKLSTVVIADALLDFIELSFGEFLLHIIDMCDADGKSNWIRFGKR